ncbi:MAG TPA: succinate dehydrogenase/fumarate reductase flavoprotein subunit, partial [Candidatus Methylomirabilis sp.]
MAYDVGLMESIRRVEATRSTRLGQQFPRLTADEKAAILKGFHPDYKAGTMRELAVGPNAGDRVPHELADLLEGQSRI